MKEPFRLLGLFRGASSREVKRAYARLLKTTRPDDDPVAFQRLNEAYEAALAFATRREREAAAREAADAAASDASAAGDGDHAGDAAPSAPTMQHDLTQREATHHDAAPAPDAAPAWRAPPLGDARPRPAPAPSGDDADPSPPPPDRPRAPPHAPPRHAHGDEAGTEERVFYVGPFVDALERQMGRGGAHLLAWLRADPVLWDVALKQAIAGPVLQALAERGCVASLDELEALQDFFGLDVRSLNASGLMPAWQHLLGQAESYGLARVRDRRGGHGREHVGEVRERMAIDGHAWRELRGPGHRGRRLFLQLMPFGPSRVASLRNDFIAEVGPVLAEQQFDAEASAYWRDAGDLSRYAWARVRIGLLRLLALLVGTSLLSAWVGYHAYEPIPPTTAEAWIRGWPGIAVVACLWMLMGASILVYARFTHWLRRRRPPLRLWALGVALSAPLLGLALAWTGDGPGPGVVLIGVALIALLAYATPRHWPALVGTLACWALAGELSVRVGVPPERMFETTLHGGTWLAGLVFAGCDRMLAHRAGCRVRALPAAVRDLPWTFLGWGLAVLAGLVVVLPRLLG